MFRGGKLPFEKDYTSIYLWAPFVLSLIGQLPSGRLIPSQAIVTLKAHPRLGNCHPKDSSPIEKLPSERFILIEVLPICLCSEERSPASRIIVQTPISRFLRLIFNWATAPRKIHPQLSNCLLSSVAEGSPQSDPMLVCSEEESIDGRKTVHRNVCVFKN